MSQTISPDAHAAITDAFEKVLSATPVGTHDAAYYLKIQSAADLLNVAIEAANGGLQEYAIHNKWDKTQDQDILAPSIVLFSVIMRLVGAVADWASAMASGNPVQPKDLPSPPDPSPSAPPITQFFNAIDLALVGIDAAFTAYLDSSGTDSTYKDNMETAFKNAIGEVVADLEAIQKKYWSQPAS